jgi:hypothetical protein
MVSLYASFRSFGLGAGFAFFMQALAGTLALLAIAVVVKRGYSIRVCLASALLATLFISPYLYDYDLVVLGVALALILPDLVKRDGNGAGGSFRIDLSGDTGRQLALVIIFSFLAAYSGVLVQYSLDLSSYNSSGMTGEPQRLAESLARYVSSDLESFKLEPLGGVVPSLGVWFLFATVYVVRRLMCQNQRMLYADHGNRCT